ncbi:hypothetical protein BX286_1213 [Streptomyces sp. 3211.6]|nr:hypothetical protein BX286_1213 [Streptomyces sp. 3211.6]RPF29290.1 hypothetical protein EDD96_5810 [Streptomyces sp. Ag109_G2-6]
MARKMTQEEWRASLRPPSAAGKPPRADADGSPHIAPIRSLPDSGHTVPTTGGDTVKSRIPALHTEPACGPTESSSRAVCTRPAYSTSRISTSFPESRSRASHSTTGVPCSRSSARATSSAP